MSNFQQVDPREYYQSLSKKEKSKFLLYLSRRYGYMSGTISGKLRCLPSGELRKDERENIINTINSGVWRI